MDHEDKRMLAIVQEALETLLYGKQCSKMEEASPESEWQGLIQQVNQLIQSLNEMNCLTLDLAEGKLDGSIPPRHNYLASPLKQLHSQLSIIASSCKQLQEGYIVSKLEFTGELFEVFNGLIDQVAAASMKETEKLTDTPVNSWRYHQILQTLDLLHILVLEVDSSGRVVYANQPAKRRLGNIKHLSSEQAQNNILLQLIAGLGRRKTFPFFHEAYDGNGNVWYRIMSNRFYLPNQQELYLYIIEDVNDWKENEYQLKLSAQMDAMTSTYNRKAGLEELERTLASSKPAKSNCLVFIDIDNLKTINDTYGHHEGDYTIKRVAQTLLSFVRSSDVVCRYGGDEFFIIFKDCTGDIAEKIIARMYSELKELNSTASKPYSLSFSHGIALFSTGFGVIYNMGDLLKEADQEMYSCKMQKKEGAKSKFT